jgi:GNAT superfamily N-acetyltransferase
MSKLLEDGMIQYRFGTIEDLDALYDSYALEFPENERKTKLQLMQLMSREGYVLLIAEDHLDRSIERIGFACLYVPQAEDFFWLDYLVIERAFQSKGYGSKFFDEMIRKWTDRKGMFIEIEIPSGEDSNQDRRITYYERLGARRLPIDYHLPTEVDDMAMYLYFKPSSITVSDNNASNDNASLNLSQAYILKAIALANSTIHWDHVNLESVWCKNQFIDL